MTYRIIKKLLKIASIASIMVAIILGSFLAWVMTGPRTLPALTPYIEEELSALNSNYHVQVTSSQISWNKKRFTFNIAVKDVSIIEENRNIANFPKVSFDFNFLHLLSGKLFSTDITIEQPRFTIDVEELLANDVHSENQQNTSFTFEKNIQPILYEAYQHIRTQLFNFTLENVKIQNASLYIRTPKTESTLTIDEGYVKFIDDTLVSHIRVNFSDTPTDIIFQLKNTESDLIDTSIDFKNLPSHILYDFFPEWRFAEHFNVLTNGSLQTKFNESGAITHIGFEISELSGQITLPEHFLTPLTIQSFSTNGSLNSNFKSLTIEHIEMQLNDTLFKASGALDIGYNESNKIIFDGIMLDSAISNIDTHKLISYWPIHTAENVRNWLATHFKSGIIPEIHTYINITQADLENIRHFHSLSPEQREGTPPPISKESISAEIQIENAALEPSVGLPVISGLSSTITFNAHEMLASIHKGKLNNAIIDSGSVTIPNLWRYPAQLAIHGTAHGPNKDLIRLLEKPKNIPSKDANFWNSLYNITGNAKGSFSLNMPLKKNISYPELNLNINATLNNTQITKISKQHTLSEGAFNLSLNPEKLLIKGNAHINGVTVPVITFTYFPEKKEDLESSYTIEGRFNAHQLQTLAIPDLEEYFKANAYISTTTNIYRDHNDIFISADLLQSDISIAPINFHKRQGIEGKLKAKLTSDDDNITLKNFHLAGDDFNLEGSAQFSKDNTIQSAKLAKAVYNRNDYQASYKNTNNSLELEIIGKSLDLSQNNFKSQNDNHLPESKKISAKLEKVILKNSTELQNVTAEIECNKTSCSAIDFNSRLNHNYTVSANLVPIGNDHILTINSDNAGALIKGLGISKYINGGELLIQSASFFDPKLETSRSEGELIIKNFTAVKTPLLGKLLTLASLKGVTDLLNDKGISFSEFNAPFSISRNIITVTNARSEGGSIGITANGTIDRKKELIHLEGAIIPAHTLNRILGNIPVIGTLMTGTKNEGLFATRYSINGSYDNAEIKTNPLSTLTPGVLRDLWGAMENKPKATIKEGSP